MVKARNRFDSIPVEQTVPLPWRLKQRFFFNSLSRVQNQSRGLNEVQLKFKLCFHRFLYTNKFLYILKLLVPENHTQNMHIHSLVCISKTSRNFTEKGTAKGYKMPCLSRLT